MLTYLLTKYIMKPYITIQQRLNSCTYEVISALTLQYGILQRPALKIHVLRTSRQIGLRPATIAVNPNVREIAQERLIPWGLGVFMYYIFFEAV